MTCRTYKVADGRSAIVCGSFGPVYACSNCGKVARRLCDWKLKGGGRCSSPVCDDCAMPVGKNKDLCCKHAEMWADHPANRQAKLAL